MLLFLIFKKTFFLPLTETGQLPSCKFSTCILQLKQSEECLQQFKEALSNHLQQHKRPFTMVPSSANEPVMLMGLHCCGDLTPTVMNIFLQLNQARLLSCISCCYHKMDYNRESPIILSVIYFLTNHFAFDFRLFSRKFHS